MLTTRRISCFHHFEELYVSQKGRHIDATMGYEASHRKRNFFSHGHQELNASDEHGIGDVGAKLEVK